MILVTGGAGFIGSNVVDKLLSFGHSVKVLDDLSTGRLSNLEGANATAGRFEFIHGSICDDEMVAYAMSGVQCVIHLAAQVSVQKSLLDPVVSSSINVQGFLKVLEAVRINNVSRFIYASSAAVYGHSTELPLSETSSVSPVSPYGLEKLIDEKYAGLYTDAYGVSCLGFRFFNVYGPRQDPGSAYAGVISKFFGQIQKSEPITVYGDGLQTRDFVYISDIVDVCVKAIDSSLSGVLCVGTGKSVNLLDLIDGIENATGKKADVVHAPPAVGDIKRSAMSPANLLHRLGVVPSVGLQSGLNSLWSYLREEASENK